MSYEALTGRLTELDAATRSDKHPNLVDEDEKFGLLYHKCSSECVPYHEAVDAFHAPAHEYVAVVKAAVGMSEAITRNMKEGPCVACNGAQGVHRVSCVVIDAAYAFVDLQKALGL